MWENLFFAGQPSNISNFIHTLKINALPADDINFMVGNNDKLQNVINRLTDMPVGFEIETSTDKCKGMVNTSHDRKAAIYLSREELLVNTFKYLIFYSIRYPHRDCRSKSKK